MSVANLYRGYHYDQYLSVSHKKNEHKSAFNKEERYIVCQQTKGLLVKVL